MSDPERLLDQKNSELEALILRSALDERPPSGLAKRTLAAIAVAGGAVTAAGSASAATGGAIKGASVGASAGAGAGAGAAGGGVLGAIGMGAIAGIITLGIAQWSMDAEEPARAKTAQEAHSARLSGLAAPRSALGSEKDEGERANGSDAREDGSEASGAPPSPSSSAALGRARAPSQRASALASEVALLDEARRALQSGDAAGALAILDRYERSFAGGQLAREAAQLRATAASAAPRARVKNP
jgi:hypothetical protein